MRRMRRALLPPSLLLCAAALAAGAEARADDPQGAGADPDAGPPALRTACVEHLPDGATRPKLVEHFPSRGLSGYASRLEVTITHGKGETVLPEGFKAAGNAEAVSVLERDGWVIPDPNGGSGPSIERKSDGAASVTVLSIPFVPLPKTPGRNGMLLPSVPIAIARASGEVMTLCTNPHAIVVEDPIANELDPKVKPNPPPRPQREDWALGRQLTIGLLLGAVVGSIGVYLLLRWLRRPKFVAPPPPRLPWLVALEELEAIRRSSLLAEARNDEYFDRVSDCVRNYLGARYGFDGLESTTDEMRSLLRRVQPRVPELKKIGAFLADSDLVKFARVLPSEDDCRDALLRGEAIVRMTIPAHEGGPAPRPPRPGARAEEARS
jgi:hypothetical protein